MFQRQSLTSQIAHTSQHNHSPTPQNKLITIKTTIHGKKEVTAVFIHKEKREQNHSPPTSETPSCPPSIFEQFLLSFRSPNCSKFHSLSRLGFSHDRSSLASSLPLAHSSRARARAFLIKSGSPTPHFCLACCVRRPRSSFTLAFGRRPTSSGCSCPRFIIFSSARAFARHWSSAGLARA